MRVLGPKGLATVVDLLDAIALGSRGIHIFVTDRAEAVAAEIEARCPAGWEVAALFAVERDRLSTAAERGSQDGHDVLLLGVVEAANASELPALHALNDQREWLLRRGVCAVVVVTGKDAQAADAAYLELQGHAPDLWSVRSRVYRAVGSDPERAMHDALLDLLSPKFGGDRALALRWLDGRAVSEEWIQNRLWREGPRREAWLAGAFGPAPAIMKRLATADELAWRSASMMGDIGPPLSSPSTDPGEEIAPERWSRPAWPSGQLDEVQQTLVRALEAALDRDGFAELHILPEDQALEPLTAAVLTVGLLRESRHRVVLHLDARNGLDSAIYQHLHDVGLEVRSLGLFGAAMRLSYALRGVDPLLLITNASATEISILRAGKFEIPVVASVRGPPYFAFCVAASRAHEERARWAKQQLSTWAGGSTVQWVRTETAPLDLRMACSRARHVVTLIDGIPRAAWQALGPASQRVVAFGLTEGEPDIASWITWHGKLDADESTARDRLRAVARGLAGEPMLDKALAVMQGAVERYRERADKYPLGQGFLDDLAMALSNLGNRLLELGSREEAMAVMLEAVEIERKLAEANPDVFLPNLAWSLDVLGCIQRERGDHAESRTLLVEGLRILLPFYLRLRSTHEVLFMQIAADLRVTCATGGLEVPPDLREWVDGEPGEADR